MFIPVLFQVNGVDSGCSYGGSAGRRIDSRVDPLVVFGRFHFHFFERQHVTQFRKRGHFTQDKFLRYARLN